MASLFHCGRKEPERWFMKTVRESVSILTSHNALKRLLDNYEDFDAASRLCADHCIMANDIAPLININIDDEIPKPKRSESRLVSADGSGKFADKFIDIGEG